MTKKLSKEEKFLILFLEDMAVNQWGIIDDMRKVDLKEIEIMKKWNNDGFIISKRVHRNKGSGINLTYAIKLSEEAWKLAHKERKEKSLRHIPIELKT